MSTPIAWKPILDFNRHMLGALVAGTAAWLFWQFGIGDLALLRVFAVLLAVGAIVSLAKALWQLTKLFFRLLTTAAFQSKGRTPKADPVVTGKLLKKRKLTR
ncbi:MAG: hypothetical protein AAGF94_18670 [Pseudomonadota bacterium]